MKSFNLPITTAGRLHSDLATHFLIEDRQSFHRPIEQYDEPLCRHCGQVLAMVASPDVGVEYVCENQQCSSNN